MVEGDSARHPCMVVVGDARDDFVRQALYLAREYDVDVTRCDDVYSAVVELAALADRRVLVAGRFREMAKEGGRFFTLTAQAGGRCCCLLGRDVGAGLGSVLVAVRTGALIVTHVKEIEPILADWLARRICRSGGLGTRGLVGEEFRATEAELNALLGRGADE
jgi:hypothetical protein